MGFAFLIGEIVNQKQALTSFQFNFNSSGRSALRVFVCLATLLLTGSSLGATGLDYAKLRQFIEERQSRQKMLSTSTVRNPVLDYKKLEAVVKEHQREKPDLTRVKQTVFCQGCYVKSVLISRRER